MDSKHKDFKKGLSTLLGGIYKDGKLKGVKEASNLGWIIRLSKKMAEKDICFNFWDEVYQQGNCLRVFKQDDNVDSLYELVYGSFQMFSFYRSQKGIKYWRTAIPEHRLDEGLSPYIISTTASSPYNILTTTSSSPYIISPTSISPFIISTTTTM